jgi:acyl dehydratase
VQARLLTNVEQAMAPTWPEGSIRVTVTLTTDEQDMYFEDYLPDRVFRLARVRVTEAGIIEFARRFDPQPYHVDADSDEARAYGGVIASGWHTCALVMRSFVEGYLSVESALPSPGVDELRWHAPVRPGDELSITVTVLEATASRSKPDRGIVRSHIEARNQNDVVVLSMTAINFVRRAPAT